MDARSTHADRVTDAEQPNDTGHAVGTGSAAGAARADRPGDSDDASVTAEDASVTAERVTVRRTPHYYRFMIAGVIVFAIVAFILTVSFPPSSDYDRLQVFGFLLLGAVIAGVGLGALAAVVVDRLSARTARTLVADRIDVRAEPEPDEAAAASGEAEPGKTVPGKPATDEAAGEAAKDASEPKASEPKASGTTEPGTDEPENRS